jgi:hypothetical protein
MSLKVVSFTVLASRVVNVAKYESFTFGLTMEVEVDPTVKTSEQISLAQKAIRQQIDAEVGRLVADLNLPAPADRA